MQGIGWMNSLLELELNFQSFIAKVAKDFGPELTANIRWWFSLSKHSGLWNMIIKP